MVLHTQTIRRLLPMNCLSVSEHFAGLLLKGLKSRKSKLGIYTSVRDIIFSTGTSQYKSNIFLQREKIVFHMLIHQGK